MKCLEKDSVKCQHVMSSFVSFSFLFIGGGGGYALGPYDLISISSSFYSYTTFRLLYNSCLT